MPDKTITPITFLDMELNDIGHCELADHHEVKIRQLEARIEQLEAIVKKLVGDIYEKDQP